MRDKFASSNSEESFNREFIKYESVSSGSGRIVTGGKLYSDGFSLCTAFTITDPESKLGGLFHLSDVDFLWQQSKPLNVFFQSWLDNQKISNDVRGRLGLAVEDICKYNLPKNMRRDEVSRIFKELGSEGISTRLFSGANGVAVESRLQDSLLGYLGVSVSPRVEFEDNRRGWAIIADFDSGAAQIYTPFDHKVREYDL